MGGILNADQKISGGLFGGNPGIVKTGWRSSFYRYCNDAWGYRKPSVSHAMKLLREDGYIAMDRYGTVTLLEKGNDIAVSYL
mgnify:CR=1 FL=1